ncbi:MAG: response regulator [Verrucomicrobiaceae bacterium]|nr:MAG: response regulator [Verrucomicrobiaceae bacterium]
MEIKYPSQSLRVLAVDDEPSVLEVLSLFLCEDGHQVETAASGEEALMHFQNSTWDVVLTDRIMPGMTGDQLVRAIRELAPQMPVVMVTGFIDAASALEMEKSGVDVIVRKPFTLASLRNGISSARARHMTRQHAA